MKNKPEISEKVKKVMAQVLGIEEESINDDSSMSNTEPWDSLRHVNLIIALEQEFGISFPDEEITLLTSVQLFIEAISNIERK